MLAEQDFAASDRADPSAAKLSKIGKVKGVRYIITGSITKFGGEQKNYGGAGIGVGNGGLGKKAKTEVNLTARLVDTSTGEVVVSAKGNGISKKGGGVSVGAIGGHAGAGPELQRLQGQRHRRGPGMACKELVAKLVAKKDRLGA